MSDWFLNFVKDHNAIFINASYNNLIINDGQKYTINHDYLSQFKSKLIIINFASEHWNQFDDNMYHDLDVSGYNFLLLTYDHTRHQMYPKMFYYPYWYYDSKCKEWSVVKNNFVQSRKFHLGCLNGNPRPHRIANYYQLMKKSYKDQMSISFYKTVNDPRRGDDVPLLDEELNYWNSIKDSLPPRSFRVRSIDLPQLLDSYLHLVTETTVGPGVFITEKTWKAVIAGVPFLLFGNPGTISFLKTLGVDTYDDVIDHAYYDNEADWRMRLTKMHTVLDHLIEYGAEKIYQQLFLRAQDNQTKFWNGDFDPGYQSQLTSVIENVSIR
jgi:hypothetical protein